jgi:hypothetical protein
MPRRTQRQVRGRSPPSHRVSCIKNLTPRRRTLPQKTRRKDPMHDTGQRSRKQRGEAPPALARRRRDPTPKKQSKRETTSPTTPSYVQPHKIAPKERLPKRCIAPPRPKAKKSTIASSTAQREGRRRVAPTCTPANYERERRQGPPPSQTKSAPSAYITKPPLAHAAKSTNQATPRTRTTPKKTKAVVYRSFFFGRSCTVRPHFFLRQFLV